MDDSPLYSRRAWVRIAGSAFTAGAIATTTAERADALPARPPRARRRCQHAGCRRRRGHRGRHTPAPNNPVPPTPEVETPEHPPSGGTGLVVDTVGLSKLDRVVASRFSQGLTPALVADVRSAGGGLAWFEDQLTRATPDVAAAVGDWWPELHQSPAEGWRRNDAGIQHGSVIHKAVASRELIRRIAAPVQVLETVAEFWHQHLHVPCDNGAHFAWRADYTEVLRRHSLGKFSDLLPALALHPAMLIYLTASPSFASHPNENLARELLELHTVGAGNYTEDDVKNCARILTGFRVEKTTGFTADFRTTEHWVGQVKVLGFKHANASRDGRAVAKALLQYLATHPATARRLSTRLCQMFVSDAPPPGLVDRLAAVYLQNGTSIAAVLRALVRSPEFLASEGSKLRDPEQDVVATYRLMVKKLTPLNTPQSVAVQLPVQVFELGVPALSWPTPEGAPLETDRWATPARALASFRLHWILATGTANVTGAEFRGARDIVPQVPLTMEDLVKHLSRQVLSLEADPALIDLACWSMQVTRGTTITADHRVLTVGWGQLLSIFLDHPSRYFR